MSGSCGSPVPNFLIVGAAKAGTTSLYYYLGQHPEIGFPKLKEPKYFSSSDLKFPHNGPGDSTVDQYAVKDFQEYQALFRNLTHYKMIGEASPDYLFYYEHSIKNIMNILGDVHIIIVLREPIQRAFSAYSYLVRDNREKLSFIDALNEEDKRTRMNWDFIWHYKKSGLYFEQVEKFLSSFSNVKVVLLDEIINDKNAVLCDLYNFLGVSTTFQADLSAKYNPSGVPNNPITKFLLSRQSNLSVWIRETLKRFVPRSVLELIARKTLVKVSITEEELRFLDDYFCDDIENLEKLLDKDLSTWKRSNF